MAIRHHMISVIRKATPVDNDKRLLMTRTLYNFLVKIQRKYSAPSFKFYWLKKVEYNFARRQSY